MATQAQEIFVTLLYPWDEPQFANLYKCVTTRYPSRSDPAVTITSNHAVQTYQDMLALIDYRLGFGRTDIYAALGTQRVCMTEKSFGYAKALRKADNMVSYNALWIDVDVKPGFYTTTAEAERAFSKFVVDAKLPEPTMIVRSGSGGFHAYWCTAKPMTKAQWEPLSSELKQATIEHGLKIDTQCIIDASRVLRVPDTLNFKHTQPTMVELIPPQRLDCRYTIEGLAQILQSYQGAKARTGTGPATATSAWQKNFTTGVDDRALPPLPIDVIAVNCPMTAQTLADGGVGKSEPEWSQDMYLAAWTADPVDAAHRMSRGHSGYSPADTDRKLAEKQSAIASDTRKGWPLCASFSHPACQTCQFLKFGKSPITFAPRVQPQPGQPQRPSQFMPNDDLMPLGYQRDNEGYVWFESTRLFTRPILDGGIGPDGELVMKFVSGGQERWGAIEPNKHSASGFSEALAKGTTNRILVHRNLRVAVGDFLMAWMTELQNKKRYAQAAPFGWDGKAFVFGDERYTDTGVESVFRGKTADDRYKRVGELKPWTDAMRLVYGIPQLETMVASAFASPLVALACNHSVILSLQSHQSGFGKTTAMQLAQAVWGSPANGMSTLSDTNNAVSLKAGALRHLPLYWDELKTQEQSDKLVEIVFSVASGQGKARLTSDIKQRSVDVSRTMFAVSSNHGILNAVIRKTEGTEAGGLRVFEYEALPLTNPLDPVTVYNMLIELERNYGNAGAVYAEWLAKHHQAAKDVAEAVRVQLNETFRFEPKERFWFGTMVTIIAGAHLANAAGLTTFDIEGITQCLGEALREMRVNMLAQTYTLAGPAAGQDLMDEMRADIRGRHMVVTQLVPAAGAGRPIGVMPLVEFRPDGDIWMQVGADDGRVLARVKAFNKWLVDHGHSPDHAMRLIDKFYVVRKRRATIGAGMDALRGQGNPLCYDMTPRQWTPPSHNPSSPSSSFGSP